ncbi:ATP-binding protein [Kitasatospora sp. MAA4]|uniref:ATP-binding protein n=1 Tax=Kitasatospora sp. MAA4 TaxID=3035093 RepID=UPI00247570E3|nr:ATP-binding protein [Kitasatospora sp. MAA4]
MDIPDESWTVAPGDTEAVAESRRRAVAAARAWCPEALPDDTADAIRRVISELVTNAIRHAGGAGPILASVWRTPGGNLAVAVEDGSRVAPTPCDPYDDGTAGRGLAIVDAESITWTWRHAGAGKIVSATIGLPGSAATARRSGACAPVSDTAPPPTVNAVARQTAGRWLNAVLRLARWDLLATESRHRRVVAA